MNIPSLIASWYKPRIAVLYLEQSLKSQFVIYLVLLFSYFSQFWLFGLYQNQEMLYRFLTITGLTSAILTLILMGLSLMSLIYAASIGFWMVAQCVKGKASLSQTRAAVLWTSLCFIPTGFLFFIFCFTTLLPIEIISYVATLFTMSYGFLVLIKTLSEVNRIGFWRTLFSVIGGFSILAIIIYLAFKFYQALGLF